MNKNVYKVLVLATFALLSHINFSNAQCSIVSGTSGLVHDIGNTTSVNYTCVVSGSAVFANLGQFTGCGITFPAILAPWSNNTNALGTATYTFSIPIYAVDIIIAYVGVNGLIQPESFTITTNGSIPVLTVDAGTCAAWTVVGNEITSPSVVGGINSFVTVTSVTPFTTLSILSGTNSSSTGGSSYGLCDASIFTSVQEATINPIDLVIYPNPTQGKFYIANPEINPETMIVELYDSRGVLANIIQDYNSIDLSGNAPGMYFYRIKSKMKLISQGKLILE